MSGQPPIIFFDGVCGLCNGFVDFVMAIDKKKTFRFATLQGEKAKELLSPQDYQNLDSIVLYMNGTVLRRSQAVLTVLKNVDGPWSLLGVFSVVPQMISDRFYDLAASVRYKIFGKKESCRIPTKEERALFFD